MAASPRGSVGWPERVLGLAVGRPAIGCVLGGDIINCGIFFGITKPFARILGLAVGRPVCGC